MRRDLISPQTVRSLEEIVLFSTRTTFYAQKISQEDPFSSTRARTASPRCHTRGHTCAAPPSFIFTQVLRTNTLAGFSCVVFFTRYLSVSEGKHKMLFVPCLFVVLRGSEGPASIQHPALLLVHNAAFYNRGKGQAFKDQTHLLIYSVYGISGLW